MQPTLIISTGLNGRSGTQSVFIRPVNSVNFNANYFMPGTMGGDHAFKFGGYWKRRQQRVDSATRGGFATVRVPDRRSRTTAGTLRHSGGGVPGRPDRATA